MTMKVEVAHNNNTHTNTKIAHNNNNNNNNNPIGVQISKKVATLNLFCTKNGRYTMESHGL